MKKTNPISISETLFYVEDDAYKKLSAYLDEVKKYFSSYEDSKEIIDDIESRIREQFLEFCEQDKTERIVTEKHVDKLIKNMGWPNEFGEFIPNEEKAETATEGKIAKRLYRNEDDAIVGGVCSGIAAYFGVDPFIVRLIFFVSIFFGGVGFFSYIFLWFVLPAAKTPIQKLEMHGDKITLEEVKKVVEEKVSGLKDTEKFTQGATNFFERVRDLFVQIFGNVFKVIGKIIGLILKVFAGIGTAFMLVFLGAGLSSGFANNMFSEFSPLPYFYLLILLVFILFIIPLWFFNRLGNRFMGRKPNDRHQCGTSLFVVWMVALFALPTFFFSNGDRYIAQIKSTTESAEVTEIKTIQNFDNLVLRNGQNVTITQGAETKVEVRGTPEGIARLVFTENNNELTISKTDSFNLCFLCKIERSEIFITTPTLSSMNVSNGSKVKWTGNSEKLELNIQNGSSVTLEGGTTNLELDIANASRLEAEDFVVNKAVVELSNASKAHIRVNDVIVGEVNNGSLLTQYGTASIDNIDENNGSSVKIKPSIE